jgi:hypothetical protein
MGREELAALAGQLQSEGYDARNLGGEGITIWDGTVGSFYTGHELREHPTLVQRRAFEEIRRRRTNGAQPPSRATGEPGAGQKAPRDIGTAQSRPLQVEQAE